MKAIWIIGAISNLAIAGFIAFDDYLPSDTSLIIVYTAMAIIMLGFIKD